MLVRDDERSDRPPRGLQLRRVDGDWVLREATEGGVVALSALDGALDVERIYRNVDLEPQAPRSVSA